jgi:hypothetical protein
MIELFDIDRLLAAAVDGSRRRVDGAYAFIVHLPGSEDDRREVLFR